MKSGAFTPASALILMSLGDLKKRLASSIDVHDEKCTTLLGSLSYFKT
jgi:hypothetical protein